MRSRLLGPLLTAAALLALPAGATATPTIGIAENNPQMFTDPLFSQLGSKHARLVVSWNVMTARNDEVRRVIDYIHGAQAAGVQVLVTFEHARGDASLCNKPRNRRRVQCRLPSPSAYRRNITLFRDSFPYIRHVVAWNEINHFTQPTYRNPRAAARFTNIARQVFRGKTVVAADILDQADNVRARRPTFRSATRYIKAFRRHYKGPRKICGVHNYSDINRFRSTGTRAIIKALGCRQIWLTEAGGIFKFAGFKASQSRQLRATKYMFRLTRSIRKVKRLYVYTWFGVARTARFDAGLVAPNGKARRAYAEVRKQIRRR